MARYLTLSQAILALLFTQSQTIQGQPSISQLPTSFFSLVPPKFKKVEERQYKRVTEAITFSNVFYPIITLVVPLLCLKICYIWIMTLIKYSGLVSGMQGKLNGSVMSKGRSGQVMYNKPRQRLEPTAYQLNVRGGFASAADFWRLATPAQRAAWITIAENNLVPNRFGDMVALSGYAYYQKMSALLSSTNPAEFLVADTVPNSVYQFTPDSVTAEFALTDQGFVISNLVADAVTVIDSPITNNYNLYISLPLADFGLPYFKTWYLVGSGELAGSIGSAEPISLEVTESIQGSGWYTFEGAKHYVKAVCFIPQQGQISVSQIWDIESTLIPPNPVPTPEVVLPADPYYGVTLSSFVNLPTGFITYITDPVVADMNTEYRANVSLNELQADTSTPNPLTWTTPELFSITASFLPDYYASADTLTFETIADVYFNAFGVSPSAVLGWYLPVRISFVKISDSSEGDVTEIFYELIVYNP